MTNFPQGSEWRKWDLHVHSPGTKLSDGYDPDPSFERFVDILERSDVQAFGITDYWSLDNFFAVKESFERKYPHSKKVLFPNLELRLNDIVNKADESVELHLLFRPDLSKAMAETFLRALHTEITDHDDRAKPCFELSGDDFKRATVTRLQVQDAIDKAFGRGATRIDHVLVVVPANNNGNRAESGKARKANIADQIDKFCDAYFGTGVNSSYFLLEDRYEDKTQRSTPKPVFSGCDAHGFPDLEQWLGREVVDQLNAKSVTWIKADLTFQGLQQTLFEPDERVRIQLARPDVKEPYKWISRVKFSGTSDFPAAIDLNGNLVSIIGSRSCGKSSLLAYVSHAVDSQYTIDRQIAAGLVAQERDAGPAAARTWKSVDHITCEVEWGGSSDVDGKVIYVPQNALYAISERPDEITARIEPAIVRQDPLFAISLQQVRNSVDVCNARIETGVKSWFRLAADAATVRDERRALGDVRAIEAMRDELEREITVARGASSLTVEESNAYQRLLSRLAFDGARAETLSEELGALAPYLTDGDTEGPATAKGIEIDINVKPSAADLPTELGESVRETVSHAADALRQTLSEIVTSHARRARDELVQLAATRTQLETENAALIAKSRANAELEELLARRSAQEKILENIGAKAQFEEARKLEQDAAVARILAALEQRSGAINELRKAFDRRPRGIGDEMAFGIENAITGERRIEVSAGFNRLEASDFVVKRDDERMVDIEKAQSTPKDFLESIAARTQRLRLRVRPEQAATDVLTTTAEIRFIAHMDGDRIGGFDRSSMTPGKQALFALTMILSESDEAWPLLIDQPEDDLDSRSIYENIVPYLKRRKRERQILMVTHNANLVVGADSEQVVVANRHGNDRKNRSNRTFDYYTGSLEHTQPKRNTPYVLEHCGIREHACAILDGGELAFQKRKNKYKV